MRIKPDFAAAPCNLGAALLEQGKLDAALVEFRRAIRINPRLSEAHAGLGNVLLTLQRLDEAIPCYREAIRLRPDFPEAFSNLGEALSGQGDQEGALAAYLEAVRIRPDYAEAYCNLGMIQKLLGRFSDALISLEKGDALGSKIPNWPHPSALWVREYRRMVELDGKLPMILKGELMPKDSEERLILAEMCHMTKKEASAARFYSEVFADRPDLAADLSKGLRYEAARAAALAGSGRSKDEPPLDDATRARLRGQALEWLNSDLTSWSKQFEATDTLAGKLNVATTLAVWKSNPDLASIRDESALAKLPEGEREAFRAFWVNLEALRKKAAGVVGR